MESGSINIFGIRFLLKNRYMIQTYMIHPFQLKINTLLPEEWPAKHKVTNPYNLSIGNSFQFGLNGWIKYFHVFNHNLIIFQMMNLIKSFFEYQSYYKLQSTDKTFKIFPCIWYWKYINCIVFKIGYNIIANKKLAADDTRKLKKYLKTLQKI